MSSLRQKGAVLRVAWFLFLVICTAQTLVRPGVAMQGAARGMQLCCETVIPSLFPFLVLCELLLQSPLAAFFWHSFCSACTCAGHPQPAGASRAVLRAFGRFCLCSAQCGQNVPRERDKPARSLCAFGVLCGLFPSFHHWQCRLCHVGQRKSRVVFACGPIHGQPHLRFCRCPAYTSRETDFFLPPCPAGKRCRRCRARRSILHGNFMRLYYFVFFSGKSFYPQYCLTPEAVCHKPSARGNSGVPESQHLCTRISCAAVHGRP